jgi:aminoglycoside phosphotransferase (APT) family kinase protein
MNAHVLDHYQLLAEGGQSKIYCYDDNKVLRVPKREMDFPRIEYEYHVYKCLNGKVPVPLVYDIIDMDGTPCLVMEKISGKDLYSGVKSNPFSLPFIPATLARLHASLFAVNSSGKFMSNHDKARYCIEHASVLSGEIRAKLIKLLESLPAGSTLCHGDFHPGNIIQRV